MTSLTPLLPPLLFYLTLNHSSYPGKSLFEPRKQCFRTPLPRPSGHYHGTNILIPRQLIPARKLNTLSNTLSNTSCPGTNTPVSPRPSSPLLFHAKVGARTLRPKINALLPRFFTDFPVLADNQVTLCKLILCTRH